MKKLIVLIMGLSISAQAAWDLNDVSYLLPLPAKVENNNLMGPRTSGAKGPLLSDAIVEKIPLLDVRRDRLKAIEQLRVVGVRIDPCFPLPTPQSCMKQIRLIWQPIVENRKKEVEFVDAAIHTFHELNQAEFSQLLKDLNQWKSEFFVETKNLALQIHPAWAQEKDQAPAYLNFKNLILRYTSHQNIIRMTVMLLRGNADMWMFASFEPNTAGEFAQVNVPGINRPSQAYRNGAVPADKFEFAAIGPVPMGDDTINTLITDSQKLSVGNEELIRKEMNAAYRIENPKIFNAENMDCVSCHTAQPAISWAQRNRADAKLGSVWSKDEYKNFKYNMQNLTPEVWNTTIIRSFGYFGKEMAINQRVINESADVADHLNKE